MNLQQEIRKIIAEFGFKKVNLAFQEELFSNYLYFSRVYSKPIQCIYGIFQKSDTLLAHW